MRGGLQGQLEAADQLEAAGSHDENVTFAANAVAEVPGKRRGPAGASRAGMGSGMVIGSRSVDRRRCTTRAQQSNTWL